MGVERLEELGVDLNTIPVPTANSQARGELNALERYAVLVRVAEAPRFPGLRKKFDRLRERGDEASAAIVDFDRSDEITHVRFGEKWMPLLREKLGETPVRSNKFLLSGIRLGDRPSRRLFCSYYTQDTVQDDPNPFYRNHR
jgi:uncharacterized ferritin-like protein (DUF455 family)